jgi:hypothetical protein
MQPTATSHRELPLPVRIFHAAMEQQLSLADYAKRLGISSESLRAIVTAQPIQDETDILEQLANTYHQPRESLLDQLSNQQITPQESFAEWLKRNMEGISQHALRTRAQVDAKTFRHFLHADLLPDSDQAERISRALYIDRAELARIVTANMAQFAEVASRTPAPPPRIRRPRRDKVNSAPQIGIPQAILSLESEPEEMAAEPPTEYTTPSRQRSQKAEALEGVAASDVRAEQEPAAPPPVETAPARRRTKAAKHITDEQLPISEASALPAIEAEVQVSRELATLPPVEAEALPSQEPAAPPPVETAPARRRTKAAKHITDEQLAIPEASALPAMEAEAQPSLEQSVPPAEIEALPPLEVTAPDSVATQGKTRKKRQAKSAQSTSETSLIATELQAIEANTEPEQEVIASTQPTPVAVVQAETAPIDSARRARSAQPEPLDTSIGQPAVSSVPAEQLKSAAARKSRAASSPAPTQEAEASTVAAVHTAETTVLQLTADEVRLLRNWRQLHPHGRRATLHYIGSLLVDE